MEIWKKDSACCVRIINHRGREVRPYPQKAKRGDKKATISAYENDHIDIKSSIVLEIAKALNCSGSYLLEGKKAEALDARIMDALLELKNDQMREVALKQIQALALLG